MARRQASNEEDDDARRRMEKRGCRPHCLSSQLHPPALAVAPNQSRHCQDARFHMGLLFLVQILAGSFPGEREITGRSKARVRRGRGGSKDAGEEAERGGAEREGGASERGEEAAALFALFFHRSWVRARTPRIWHGAEERGGKKRGRRRRIHEPPRKEEACGSGPAGSGGCRHGGARTVPSRR